MPTTFVVLGICELTVALSVLAPSDDAIVAYLSSEGVAGNDTSIITDAWLAYHMLQGTHSKTQLGSATQFLPTLLTDHRYSNVTGGQRLEIQSQEGQVHILSAFKSGSNVMITVCTSPTGTSERGSGIDKLYRTSSTAKTTCPVSSTSSTKS